MDDKIKLKKYFVKDEEITSTEEDTLNASDVAENISLVIDSTKPPFAIAVTGQSGVGKSSAINMVSEMYETMPYEYNVEKINVWKEETSLKEILENKCIAKNQKASTEYQGLYHQSSHSNESEENRYYAERNSESADENEEVVNENNEYETPNEYTAHNSHNNYNEHSDHNENNSSKEKNKYNEYANNKYKNKTKKHPILNKLFATIKLIFTFIACFILTTTIFIFMEYLQNADIYNENDIFFVENTYLNYRENIILILVFSLGLTAIAYIVNTLRITAKKFKEEKKLKEMANEKEESNSKTEIQKSGVAHTTSVTNAKETENSEEITHTNNDAKNRSTTNIEDNDDIAEVIVEDILSDDESIAEDNYIATDESYIAENGYITESNYNAGEYAKNIIIVEDIDKLTLSKMLKTLEEIKYCTEYENCIFIVPFDEKVLAKAISARNQLKVSGNYRPLKFEKVIDKIFEFKVDMPHITNADIREYAISLARTETTNFTTEYCNIKAFEKVIRNILVYKNVTTPRHVKKLMNKFISNKILISQRLEKGNMDGVYAQNKNFDLQLAKLSVLQEDFKEFYNMLFERPDYLETLTQLYCMEPTELADAYNNIDNELRPFFTNKYKPLINFLLQTRNYKIENISTLMYLTKVRTEKIFKNKPILSYILGNEEISELRLPEILALVKEMETEEDVRQFANNNFEKLLENYERNASNKEYFTDFSEIVSNMNGAIDPEIYNNYLEIVANNYNYYPHEALQMFKNVENSIPAHIMNILIEKMKESISKDNYDETFEFLRENSDPFYEENGNVSVYVQFLVDYIRLASNPTDVIVELDENFTRIGKVYELNRNIKGLTNLDYSVAYKFLAKCLDNGDLDRLVTVINNILSDANSVEDCLNIEERMDNYDLIDVVECDVDDIVSVENANSRIADTNKSKNTEPANSSENQNTELANSSESQNTKPADSSEALNSDQEENAETKNMEQDKQTTSSEELEELTASTIENAKLLDGNYTLLRNLIEICAIKQENVNPADAMKLIEKALSKVEDEKYILEVYELLNKFDRMYFYEIRRAYNEVIYASFHTAKNDKIRKTSLACTRYFKNTRLFLTKLTDKEKAFYNKN
ncbi:MAG: hypothetical protein IKD76_00685 [Clostridia bacterium]|nr:hypothetical protein [Clostridia bacterium]